MKDFYLEENCYVSIDAAGFHRKRENDDIKITLLKGIGYDNTSVQLGDPLAPWQHAHSLNGPQLEYDFYTFNSGAVTIYLYALPTFPIYAGRTSSYGIIVDDQMIKYGSTDAPEYSNEWKENVIRNSAIYSGKVSLDKPGKHTLRILCQDPGVVIQKIVIDMGGLKSSYLAPEATR